MLKFFFPAQVCSKRRVCSINFNNAFFLCNFSFLRIEKPGILKNTAANHHSVDAGFFNFFQSVNIRNNIAVSVQWNVPINLDF
jgi:hypothetical protein